MRIGFISDLHFDMNVKVYTDFLRVFSDTVLKMQYDIVIIVGDISSYSEEVVWFVEEVERQTGKKVYFVPGNHDIWSHKDSWDAYNTLVSHPACFSNQDIHLTDNMVLVGDLFWYDYSFNYDPQNLFTDRIHKKSFRGTTWEDKKWAKWGKDDKDVSDFFIAKMKERLQGIKSKNIIFASHMVPFKDFVLIKNDWEWNYFNNFIGSDKIGELIKEYKPIMSFCGHTHRRCEGEAEANKVICRPLGYVGEWNNAFDLRMELENTFYTVEL